MRKLILTGLAALLLSSQELSASDEFDALEKAAEISLSIAKDYKLKSALEERKATEVKGETEEVIAIRKKDHLISSAAYLEIARSEYWASIRELQTALPISKDDREVSDKILRSYKESFKLDVESERLYMEAEEVIAQQKTLTEYLVGDIELGSVIDREELLKRIARDLVSIADINERLARVYNNMIVDANKLPPDSPERLNFNFEETTKRATNNRKDAAKFFEFAANCYGQLGDANNKINYDRRARAIHRKIGKFKEDKE